MMQRNSQEEDELVRKRVEAKNGLESYLYNAKSSITDEKLRIRLKKKIENH